MLRKLSLIVNSNEGCACLIWTTHSFPEKKKLKNRNTEETMHPSKWHLRTFPISKVDRALP